MGGLNEDAADYPIRKFSLYFDRALEVRAGLPLVYTETHFVQLLLYIRKYLRSKGSESSVVTS